MIKAIFAVVISSAVIYMGSEHGIIMWISAAIACAFLETVILNNIVFFIPAAAGGAGAFGQFFVGDTKTATIAAVVVCLTTMTLMYKELTKNVKAQELAKQQTMKKLRNQN